MRSRGLRMRSYRGPEIKRRVQEAAREAIDEVTAEAADEARVGHWWHARRGSAGLEGQITNEAAALVSPVRVRGRFGYTQGRGFYGLFLEKRIPTLRPAADAAFPRLADRIRGKL